MDKGEKEVEGPEDRGLFGHKKLDLKSRIRLMQVVSDDVIGKDAVFQSPFGLKRVVYCDWIASGRSLGMIEDFIRLEVLPSYANTHNSSSLTGQRTSELREDARCVIGRSVNACCEKDVVVFVGSGCTGAVHKLIGVMNFFKPPVVFVGPFEHHSNYLPWKEIAAKLIRIRADSRGCLDMVHLEMELKKHQRTGHQLVGSFSAASNITGILTDTRAVTFLLHKWHALAFWDFACAGPYVSIDMNPLGENGENNSRYYNDAIFLSPHKFLGGPETPGVLVAKKKLFQNPVPNNCGGGTVLYVTSWKHMYLSKVEEREEGGTPSIVGAIRAGLVFRLKDAISHKVIVHREEELKQMALTRWRHLKSLILLGNLNVPRLPIFSFLVLHPESGLYLHHNFVCCLLNDLFGIQARGGCACAGPYSSELLLIDRKTSRKVQQALERTEVAIIKPGFSRLSLSYATKDEDIQLVLEAVSLVAEQGWKILPYYDLDLKDASWKFRTKSKDSIDRDIKAVSTPIYGTDLKDIKGIIQSAKNEFIKAESEIHDVSVNKHYLEGNVEDMRWFLLPEEAKDYLIGRKKGLVKDVKFLPKRNVGEHWWTVSDQHKYHENHH